MPTRQIVDIPELVKTLRDQQARCRDIIVPGKRLSLYNDGGLVTLSDGAGEHYEIQKQTHGQIAAKTDIPQKYYDKMLENAQQLLETNANHWLNRSNKKYLVRLIDQEARALLSDRYRPINHLDIVTVAVQVVTGQDGNGGEEKPWARGARCLSWDMSPTNLNIRFLNPGIYADLENLDRGVVTDDPGREELENRIFRRGAAADRTNWGDSRVYPSGLISNSETGHGGLNIEPGLMEGLCTNFNWYGTALEQRHLGKTLEMDDVLSSETYRKMNAVIMAKAGDVLRSVFDPEKFLETCRKFKGLQIVEINVREAVDNIVSLPGMTEDLRDDILGKYAVYKANGGRSHDNLFDLNRAITETAQNVDDQDKALALEKFGGEIIKQGAMALAVK